MVIDNGWMGIKLILVRYLRYSIFRQVIFSVYRRSLALSTCLHAIKEENLVWWQFQSQVAWSEAKGCKMFHNVLWGRSEKWNGVWCWCHLCHRIHPIHSQDKVSTTSLVALWCCSLAEQLSHMDPCQGLCTKSNLYANLSIISLFFFSQRPL